MKEEEKVKLSMCSMETNGENANIEKILKLREQLENREIEFCDYVTGVQDANGDIEFGNFDIIASKSKETTIEAIMKKHKRGEIAVEDMRRQIEDHGADVTFWDWEKGENPRYKPEESKLGFTWNPNFSKKGKFMQNVTKTVVKKMVDFVYKSILKYHKDAFEISDPRLVTLREYAKSYVIQNLSVQYKKDLVRKIVDIGLFFMKEDVYYRVLGLKMLNGVPSNFEISKDELSFFNREVPKK